MVEPQDLTVAELRQILAITLMHHDLGRPLIPPCQLIPGSIIPKALLCPTAVACLPHASDVEGLPNLMILIARNVDLLINSKSKNFTKIEDLVNYYRVTLQSRALNLEARMYCMVECGLANWTEREPEEPTDLVAQNAAVVAQLKSFKWNKDILELEEKAKLIVNGWTVKPSLVFDLPSIQQRSEEAIS